jgi:hypothetical protein
MKISKLSVNDYATHVVLLIVLEHAVINNINKFKKIKNEKDGAHGT